MHSVALPRVAVIVVNYGSHALLADNLRGITGTDCEVVVVDNFAGDAERQAVEELGLLHGWTTVLLSTNTGFGGGINRGVDAARRLGIGTFLFLNPDARIDAASLAALRRRSADHPLALISPRVLSPDGAAWFEGADLYLRDGSSRASRKRSPVGEDRVHPWLSGACLITTTALWDRVGGFDEEYFLYWEDIDLSFRVVEAGGSLVVADDAVVIHEEGGTHGDERHTRRSRGKSSTYYYFNIRNRLLFAARHLPERDRRRWIRTSVPAARDVLLQGGRRQFLHPVAPLRAALRGTLHGLKLARTARPAAASDDA